MSAAPDGRSLEIRRHIDDSHKKLWEAGGGVVVRDWYKTMREAMREHKERFPDLALARQLSSALFSSSLPLGVYAETPRSETHLGLVKITEDRRVYQAQQIVYVSPGFLKSTLPVELVEAMTDVHMAQQELGWQPVLDLALDGQV